MLDKLKLFFLFIALLTFAACTNHQLKGKLDLDSGSAEWINNISNNNCDTYESPSGHIMHLRNAYGIATYYNETILDCKNRLIYKNCTTYDLQGMSLYYIQDISITYRLQKNNSKTGNWDNLNIVIRENDKTIDVNKILYTTDNSVLLNESYLFVDSVVFPSKTFYNVFYMKTGVDSSQIYFNKTNGVVAFRMQANDTLWVQK